MKMTAPVKADLLAGLKELFELAPVMEETMRGWWLETMSPSRLN